MASKMDSPVPWSSPGKILLPTIIEQRACHDHRQPFASLPKTNDPQDGFRDISYRTFENAINRCARWIIQQIGTSSISEPLAFISHPSDFRYQILAVAAAKTGHVMLFPSHQNSLDAHLLLIDETSTTKLVATSRPLPIVPKILRERGLTYIIIPELRELLEETPVEPITFDSTFDKHCMKTWVILQTSGSTGMPKPFPLRHGLISAIDTLRLFTGNMAQPAAAMRMFSSLTPSHPVGFMWSLSNVVWLDGTIVLSPNVALNSDFVNSILVNANIEYAVISSSTWAEISRDAIHLRNLRRLKAFAVTAQPAVTSLDLSNPASTRSSLQRYIADKTHLGLISFDQDFFQAGMHPFEAIDLARTLNETQEMIQMGDVYDHSTISKLASFLHHSSHPFGDDTWTQLQQMYVDFIMTLEQTFQIAGNGSNSDYLLDGHSFEREGIRRKPVPEYSVMEAEKPVRSVTPPRADLTAWMQVIASFLINLNNFGLVNSFGAYQSFYQQNFLSDYSASSISWIGTIQAALVLIVGAFSGPLLDAGYMRIVLTVASISLVFAQMMLSLATEYYQIMLAQGVLIGCSCGLLYVPAVSLIPLYFKEHRGLALGLATGGGSIGGVLYPIIFRRLVSSVGFGWATRSIGLIMLVTLTVASIVIRPLDQLKKPRRDFFDLKAMREIPFLTFMVVTFLLFAAYLVAYFLTPSYALEQLGVSEDLSFYLIAVINAAQFFGRVISATLSDYVGTEIPLFIGAAFASILAFCWIAVQNLGGYVVFLVLYGFFSGMLATLPASIVPNLCPSLNVLGTRMGMVYASAGVGALIGAPIATAANKSSGGFLGSQLWMGVCCLVACFLFPIPGITVRRRREALKREKREESSKGNRP